MTAGIAKYTSDAIRLTQEIAEHNADTAAWRGEQKAVTKVRHIEKADYDAMHTDYSESVDALSLRPGLSLTERQEDLGPVSHADSRIC